MYMPLDKLVRMHNQALERELFRRQLERAERIVREHDIPKNPDSPPPLDPYHDARLAQIGARMNRRYRWYWMKESRIFGIQEYVGGDKWQTVFACYDEERACQGNWYPFMMPDERVYREFMEKCLEIRYDTGDLDKDHALHAKETDERLAAEKQRKDQEGVEAIFQLITGGDPVRHERFLNHAAQHTPDGCGFREFFPGADLKKGAS